MICSCLPSGLVLWGNPTGRISPSLLAHIDPGKGFPVWDKADCIPFLLKDPQGSPHCPREPVRGLAGPSVGPFQVLLRPWHLPLLPALQSSPSEVQPFPTSQSPLGCHPFAPASLFPGDAFSSHGAPPRSPLTPQGKPSTPENCACLQAGHLSSIGGQFLSVHLLRTRSSLKATSVIFASSITSRKPGLMWVSSQCLPTRYKDHTQAEDTSQEGDMAPKPRCTRSPCDKASLAAANETLFPFQKDLQLRPSKRELLCLKY